MGTVAFFPTSWMGLFGDDEEIIRVGASYLTIAGPIYGLYGLGMAIFFATQGFGSVVATVTANALRLLASAGGAMIAVYWLDLGVTGFFVAVALGFCIYAALSACAVIRVKIPVEAAATEQPACHGSKGDSSHASIAPIYFAGR
jgi:Na+-driven multidrug efflux pump